MKSWGPDIICPPILLTAQASCRAPAYLNLEPGLTPDGPKWAHPGRIAIPRERRCKRWALTFDNGPGSTNRSDARIRLSSRAGVPGVSAKWTPFAGRGTMVVV